MHTEQFVVVFAGCPSDIRRKLLETLRSLGAPRNEKFTVKEEWGSGVFSLTGNARDIARRLAAVASGCHVGIAPAASFESPRTVLRDTQQRKVGRR